MCEQGGKKANCPFSTICNYHPESIFGYFCNCSNGYNASGVTVPQSNVQNCKYNSSAAEYELNSKSQTLVINFILVIIIAIIQVKSHYFA